MTMLRTLKFLPLLLSAFCPLAGHGSYSADPQEEAREEQCAVVIKAFKKNPSVKLLENNQTTLDQCSQAQVKDLCDEAKKLVDSSQQSKVHFKGCLGTQVAAQWYWRTYSGAKDAPGWDVVNDNGISSWVSPDGTHGVTNLPADYFKNKF